jgi:hypothetical protein
MNTPSIRFCIDQIVPEEYHQIAAQHAIAENPANANPFEAAAETAKLWRPGRVLRVRFLNGDPLVQQRVIQYARQWSDYANISFDFGEHPDAEIRISFNPGGSWSAVGTDALITELFPPEQATMNFGWLQADSSDEVYSAVVLHEFGHALGLIHEHQNPDQDIPWNRQAIIDYLSRRPYYWTEAQIERNIFQRYSVTQTQYSTFDPESIMLYAFPTRFTLDGRHFPENKVLSAMDKQFIAECYPQSES